MHSEIHPEAEYFTFCEHVYVKKLGIEQAAETSSHTFRSVCVLILLQLQNEWPITSSNREMSLLPAKKKRFIGLTH